LSSSSLQFTIKVQFQNATPHHKTHLAITIKHTHYTRQTRNIYLDYIIKQQATKNDMSHQHHYKQQTYHIISKQQLQTMTT